MKQKNENRLGLVDIRQMIGPSTPSELKSDAHWAVSTVLSAPPFSSHLLLDHFWMFLVLLRVNQGQVTTGCDSNHSYLSLVSPEPDTLFLFLLFPLPSWSFSPFSFLPCWSFSPGFAESPGASKVGITQGSSRASAVFAFVLAEIWINVVCGRVSVFYTGNYGCDMGNNSRPQLKFLDINTESS